jgi:hypothetical protein
LTTFIERTMPEKGIGFNDGMINLSMLQAATAPDKNS